MHLCAAGQLGRCLVYHSVQHETGVWVKGKCSPCTTHAWTLKRPRCEPPIAALATQLNINAGVVWLLGLHSPRITTMSLPNTDAQLDPAMASFPNTDPTFPPQEFPDNIMTMFDTQAKLFADREMWWDPDTTLDYDGTFSFPESTSY